MSRELTPERQAAHVATLKTLIFDTLEHTKANPKPGYTEEDIGVAVSAAIESMALATQEMWSDRFAIIGLVSVLGYRIRQGPGRQYLYTAMNALSALLGSDLITTPMKAKLDGLQGYADAVASLDIGPETDSMLAAMIERARSLSEARPSGHRSDTPLNDTFRRGRDHVKGDIQPGQSAEDAHREAYEFRADVPGHEAPEGGKA